MKKINFVLALLLVLIFANSLRASGPADDPLTVGAGARPMGMGLAFVALADDANASFINPAGLGGLKEAQVTSMYGNLMGEVNYLLFGAVYPSDFGCFGVSYLAHNSADIPFTTIDSVTGRVVANGTFSYDSNLIMLSYGKSVDFIIKNLYVGANLKWLSKGFTQVSAAGSINADVGLLYKATDWLSLGFARQNTLPGSLGQLKWGGSTNNDILVNNKIGVMVKPVGWPVLANLDLDINSKAKLFHAGIEWQAFKNELLAVALRAGIEQKLNANLGKSNDLTLGVGFEAGQFGFDYAYQTIYDEPEAVTHYFSFSYKFKG